MKNADGSVIATYAYYDNGARKKLTHADGSFSQYTYDLAGRLSTEVNADKNGVVLQSYSYAYDAANNLVQKTETVGDSVKTTAYTYDAHNRVKTVTETGGKQTAYTYDKAGNRKTMSVTADGTTTQTTYTYNEQERLLNTVVTANGVISKKTIYTYDNNGNTLVEAEMSYTALPQENIAQKYAIAAAGDALPVTYTIYTYDALNRLITTQKNGITVKNTYNAEGVRIAKTVNGETEYYLTEGAAILLTLDETANEKSRNIYGINLLQRVVGNESYTYLYNGHGDVVALVNNEGTIVATYEYDEFGNITAQTGDVDNPYRYAGYIYDEEIGVYYLQSRYYQPSTGRFLQRDRYLGTTGDPLSLNLYTYCTNNPMIYIDPTGYSGQHGGLLGTLQYWINVLMQLLSGEYFDAFDTEIMEDSWWDAHKSNFKVEKSRTIVFGSVTLPSIDRNGSGVWPAIRDYAATDEKPENQSKREQSETTFETNINTGSFYVAIFGFRVVEKWKKYSERFGDNEYIIALNQWLDDSFYPFYYEATKWHFEDREALNGEHPQYSDVLYKGWRKLPPNESVFHDNHVGKPEEKYVEDTKAWKFGDPVFRPGAEAVFDGDTQLPVTDQQYIATFNYVNLNYLPNNPNVLQSIVYGLSYIGHGWFDVLPYLVTSNSNTREQFEEKIRENR